MKVKILAILSLLLLVTSCGSRKEIAYLQEADQIPLEVLQQSMMPANTVVMPGDLLDILVATTNIEASKPFNRMGVLTEIASNSYNNSNNTTNNSQNFYLVDQDGNIEFPVVGTLHIGGMNKKQIEETVVEALYPKYLSERPSVDIRFRNFKVSVVGEVKNPGVYTSLNERMNILEALAMAGDLNITARRDNIMLIRLNADGTKNVEVLNLNDNSLITSPYFNLQQNDIIYVEPNKSKINQSWTIPPAVTLALSSIGTLVSIATLIVTITK